MYPNLTPTLVALLAGTLAAAAFIAIRRPFLRRLALRQVTRRRTEATLVVAGSVLGAAVIVAALVVGDTLNFSVKQDAYQHLGPVDEVVSSSSLAAGQQAAVRLAPLRTDPRVDGLLTVYVDQGAATAGHGRATRAVPRTTVVEADLDRAARFGAAGSPSGLSGPTPTAERVVVNTDLAKALGVRVGSPVTFYLYGQPVTLTVARVVPTRGLAGYGENQSNGTAFVGTWVLRFAAFNAGVVPQTQTLVSNRGGVESGNALTAPVAQRIHTLLGPLASSGSAVLTPKHDLLKAARDAGNGLGSLFLFIGSFSIIVGIVLLLNIYVMLAEERKPEMGMLRAIGMKRSRLVRSFVIEGSVYALLASVVGVLVGIGVGRLAVIVAARLFRGGGTGAALTLAFHVTPVSLVNGLALGALIAMATVTVMSIRISRFNIIAAVRDLPQSGARRHRRLTLALCTAGSALAALASIPVIAAGRSLGVYLLPTLAVLLAIPPLQRVASSRVVISAASGLILAWTALANTVRPGVLQSSSTTVYIVMGCLLAVSGVVLVSQNQTVLLAPFRRFIERPRPSGLTARIAVTYPLTRRFRTGAILVMYTLIVFTLVLLSVLSAMIGSTVNEAVAAASGGYALRADFNPTAPVPDIVRTPHRAPLADEVAAVMPLVVAPAKVADLGPRRLGPADVSVVGLPAGVLNGGTFPLTKRLAVFGADDRAAWRALATNPQYVMLDAYVAAPSGGPPAELYKPGDRLTLMDVSTGRTQTKVIAGIMKSSFGFVGVQGRVAYPVLMSAAAARAEFGTNAKLGSALVRPAAGVTEDQLAAHLQAQYLASGMVVSRIDQEVRRNYAANLGFFQLMQGFLALGLLIAIAGLGVVMVRAVRERRRTIGVLRALGFRARWVKAAFLGESALVATEGIVLGTGLSIFVSYLLFRNNTGFSGYHVGFTVPWVMVAVIVTVAWLASLLATYLPARKAAGILPAVALRITD